MNTPLEAALRNEADLETTNKGLMVDLKLTIY